MPVAVTAAAAVGSGRYIHWGVLNVSLTNLLIIVAMVVLFLLAIVVPFGGDREARSAARHTARERRRR